MESAIHIRVPTPADYDPWRKLWDGYNAFYGRSGAAALPPGRTTDLHAEVLVEWAAM